MCICLSVCCACEKLKGKKNPFEAKKTKKRFDYENSLRPWSNSNQAPRTCFTLDLCQPLAVPLRYPVLLVECIGLIDYLTKAY